MRPRLVARIALTLACSASGLVHLLAHQSAAALTGPSAVKSYERDKAVLLKTAELMPAEHFGFRQAANDKPFSAQLIAVAALGVSACGELLGKPGDLGTPDPQATIVTKPAVINALSKGFATCDAYFGTLTDGKVPADNVRHILDHMNSMATYLAASLRAKGIDPPR